MPPQIHYEGRSITPQARETVLDSLLRAGVDVPFSCKSGSCHTCLMQCTEGNIPVAAQQGLPEHLTRMHYLLPCQCQPEGEMRLRPPQPQDLVTTCMLCEATLGSDGTLHLIFEPLGTLRYRTGQTLRVVAETGGAEAEIRITSNPATDAIMQGSIQSCECVALPAQVAAGAEFGVEFAVRVPYDDTPVCELPAPTPDPALWQELGDGRVVRAVLEAFYPKVYADAQLGPFFRTVTIERSIDKQYSFLKQSMTGEKIYMGDRPRNAHHWMIITHALFDLRQSLMEETLREYGLSAAQIQRWTRFEEHYRPDIVKNAIWPRLENGVEIMKEGFERETLLEGSLCDHCGQEIPAGTEVLYHTRPVDSMVPHTITTPQPSIQGVTTSSSNTAP